MSIDLTTPEGIAEAVATIKREEKARFRELMAEFINGISDDVLRESLESALDWIFVERISK